MECDPRSSSGSTVSGDFNKRINPFGYVYIIHPFGALANAQNQYLKNLKETKIEDRKMNFRCPEYYRTKLVSHQNSVNANHSAQNQIKEKKENNIVFEVPDFKYIIDSIRRAWYASNLPLRYDMLKNQPNNTKQDNETIRNDVIFKRPKELIRRYSVPETAIRKYKFIFDHSCTKSSNNNISINSNLNNLHKTWKYKDSCEVVKDQQQMKNITVSVLDLPGNLETPMEKPLTMPEIQKKKECFYCSTKKNKTIEKFEQNSTELTDTSKKNSKQNSNSSDHFISDLLICNLNEDMNIAEMLINTLNNDNSKIENTLSELKVEHYVSSIYFSPERLLRTANTDKKVKIYRSCTDINLKSNESSEIQSFVKENLKADTETKNVSNKLNHQQSIGEMNLNKSPTALQYSKSKDINNSLKLTNNSDDELQSTSELKILPIENKKIYDNGLKMSCRARKFISKEETLDLANIQTNFKQQIIKSGIQNIGNNYKTPLINELIKTPLKFYSPCSKQGTISKSILNSLEAYTFDSGGNINFRVLSSAISNHECPPINGDYNRKAIQKKNTSPNNVRKITIFEAQSNMVTPDNDNGPKRFYQKTEIVNGDKKIDILEIVECIQNSMDYKPKTVFNTKVSKIPILIDKFKFIKNENNHTEKNIIQPKLSKIEINDKEKVDKKYDKNIRKIFTTNDKNDFTMPKLMYPLENVTKPQKINSKIQAVKPLRPLTDNLTKEVASQKYYNLSRADIKDQYSTTSAYNSTVTDRTFPNTVTPSSGTAIHGSTSHNINLSEESFSKPDYSQLLRTNNESFLTKTNLNGISNLNSRKNLENTKTLTHDVCQYDYKRQNKLNAWRIPSSDFYDKNKCNVDMQIESMPSILPKTSNTESTIKCKNICNSNCQLCSCCSTFTANSRIIYSPTLSVCSWCSKICNTDRLTTCNTNCTCKDKDNCKEKDIIQCNKNCKNFQSITNRTCECMSENLNVSYLCNQQQTSSYCQYSRCSKMDDLMFPEGALSNSRLDFTSDGLVTASSAVPESNWKSTNGLLSCNWNSNKNQCKTFNGTAATNKSSEKNTNSKPVWTVTVTTKSLPKAPDLTMEFKFPQPPAELSIENNSENEENDNFSLDSDNSIEKNDNPSGGIYSSENKRRTVVDYTNFDEYDDKDFGGYSLNLPKLLPKRNGMKLKPNCKNLSVMGNAIAPEEKPRVQTMSERDLTRRKYQRTINN